MKNCLNEHARDAFRARIEELEKAVERYEYRKILFQDHIAKIESERDEWKAKSAEYAKDSFFLQEKNDALRASLRDMVEYTQDYLDGEDAKCSTDKRSNDVVRADIANARGLL